MCNINNVCIYCKTTPMPNNLTLQVAEPCHENWNRMTVADQGRFCQSCQKTVTDFSQMNDKEILQYLSQRGADTCGRFSNDQLNRTLIAEDKKKYSWPYIWNIVLATLLTASTANAQPKTSPVKKTAVPKKRVVPKEDFLMGEVVFTMPRQLHLVKGAVIDSKTNLPIPFASVQVEGSESGVSADANGKFSFNVLFNANEMTVSVSAIGYTKQEYTVTNTTNMVSFYLDPEVQLLDEIVITGLNEKVCTTTVGFLVSWKEINYTEKINRRVIDFTPESIKKKEVKIAPNPVKPGATATILLSLKETGTYTMEIVDEEGRIMYRNLLTIQSKQQSVTISTNASWSRGIYWVRVSGNNVKKVFHAKLVLQ